METAKYFIASTYLFASTIGALLKSDESIEQIEFKPEWHGRTGYMDGLIADQEVPVADEQMAITVDDHGRWILIGRYRGELVVLFQRYSHPAPNSVQPLAAVGTKEPTTVIFQARDSAPGSYQALVDMMDVSSCSSVSAEQVLIFLAAFHNGQAAYDAIEAEIALSKEFSQQASNSAAGDAAVSQPIADHTTSLNKDTAMSQPKTAEAISNAAENISAAIQSDASTLKSHAADTVVRIKQGLSLIHI